MNNSALRNRLIHGAVKGMLDKGFKRITPALVLSAAFDIKNSDPVFTDPETGRDNAEALSEFAKLREILQSEYLDRYFMNGSVREYNKAFGTMAEVFLLIAEEEDEDISFSGVYREAVIACDKEQDNTATGLVSVLLEMDEKLKDHEQIKTILEKINASAKAHPEKTDAEALFEKNEPLTPTDITAEGMRMHSELRGRVFGQDAAVDELVRGYMQYLTKRSSGTVRTPAVFLFAGPSGMGKSSLAKAFRECAGLPYKQFDMTQYSDHQSHTNLIGYAKSYKEAQSGTLTSFVADHPACVLLFDEIEKAHVNVKNLFLQILEDGILMDDYEKKNVSFSKAILIFTTNAGRSLYETTERKLSTIPRETVISAIQKEKNDAGYISIPPALLSRFAAGHVIMFDNLNTMAMMQIVRRSFDQCAADYQKQNGIEITAAEGVIPSVMYSIGGRADARKVASASENFFRESVASVIRRLEMKGNGDISVSRIRFVCDQNDTQAKKLLYPQERLKTLFFGFKKKHANLNINDLDRALSVDDALRCLSTGEYELLLCDINYWHTGSGSRKRNPLSGAKQNTYGRMLMNMVLENYPSIPVYVVEDKEHTFDVMDRLELQRQGVWGFMNIDDPSFAESFREVMLECARSKNMFRLTRSNSIVSFNTVEYLSEGGEEAEISFCEYSVDISVQAQDENSILDKLSMPSDTFDDVIGQEQVKQEMKFFIDYLRNPGKYKKLLRDTPKGLLLYGPAGTGKTMLARAFAHEADLAFIATQGNEFTGTYGAYQLHRLFATARKYAPSVIFIDEIDALAKIRTGQEQNRENALTALLAEMDGFGTADNRPVFLIAATNYTGRNPNMRIDPAVQRRFDRLLFVDLPDKSDRLKVLKAEIEKHKDIFRISDAVIENTATRTAGESFAWLRSMIAMQIRTMIMKNLEYIDDRQFEDTLEEYKGGRPNQMSYEAVLATARHEAGHALLNAYYGHLPAYITITSRGGYGGYTQMEFGSDGTYTKEELFQQIATLMAGRAAEIVYYGAEQGINTGAYNDLVTATEIAQKCVAYFGMDNEFGMAVFAVQQDDLILRSRVNDIIREQLDEAMEIIKTNRNTFEALTSALLKKNHLNSYEIREVFIRYPMKERGN